jgi:hypothetical protein
MMRFWSAYRTRPAAPVSDAAPDGDPGADAPLRLTFPDGWRRPTPASTPASDPDALRRWMCRAVVPMSDARRRFLLEE